MPEEKTQELNLYQKLSKIRAIADAVQKNKKGFNYTYAEITEILAKVTAGMNKYGVSLLPLISPGTSSVEQVTLVNTKIDKATGAPYEQTTTEFMTRADMVFRWVNDESPGEQIDVPWLVIGMQSDPSQGFGSGLTYCKRYFLTNYFHIATPDSDVDTYRSKQKEAAAAEDRAVASSIISDLNEIVKDYISSHKGEAEKVKTFMCKYVKNGNYLGVKEPQLAGKLLVDFKETFLGGE